MATPYMNLVLPTVGPAGTFGPDWAEFLNDALEEIDSHDHNTGKGVKITPTALNINSNLDFQGNSATNVLRLFLNTTTGTSVNHVFQTNGELFYRDGSGNNVQITSLGSVNVSGAGNITGMGATTAAVTYNNSLKTFTFTQNAGITADVIGGSIYVSENVSSGKYARLKVPTGLGSNYDIELPSAPPASTKIMTMSNSGVVGVTYDLDNSTVEVSSNTIRVKDLGITTAKIAANAVTQEKRVALGQQVSAPTTFPYAVNSTTVTPITELTVTITTTGRPVWIGLISSSTTVSPSPSEGYIGTAFGGSGTSATSYFYIHRNTANISTHTLAVGDLDGGVNLFSLVPCSTLHLVDVVAAGTYTYDIRANAAIGDAALVGAGVKLVAFEL